MTKPQEELIVETILWLLAELPEANPGIEHPARERHNEIIKVFYDQP
jgi:hypothetical protein